MLHAAISWPGQGNLTRPPEPGAVTDTSILAVFHPAAMTRVMTAYRGNTAAGSGGDMAAPVLAAMRATMASLVI